MGVIKGMGRINFCSAASFLHFWDTPDFSPLTNVFQQLYHSYSFTAVLLSLLIKPVFRPKDRLRDVEKMLESEYGELRNVYINISHCLIDIYIYIYIYIYLYIYNYSLGVG